MSLEKLLASWNLSAPVRIAQTHTSEIYQVQREDITLALKILNERGLIYEKDGPLALASFAGRGAVQLIDATTEAQLLEWVPGPKLGTLTHQGRDQEAILIISEVLQKLHSSNLAGVAVMNLEQNFHSLFSRGASSLKTSIFYQTLKVAEEILSSPRDKVLLHGDIHHDNILSGPRGWLAIDPQPLIGEKLYDYANCFFNPDDCPALVESVDRIKKMANLFARKLDVDPQRLLKFAFAHGGLSMSWQLDDGKTYDRRLRITRLLGACLGL